MTMSGIRPTQFHGVSAEERAVDSHGTRLPWALEYPDLSESLRSVRRSEEKGSFGKPALRRKTSTRATRTQTPVKKDNTHIDGFDGKWAETSSRQSQTPHDGTLQSQREHQASPSECPVQVMIYGYSPDSQGMAIAFYEDVSGGMICEDYERGSYTTRKRLDKGLGSQVRPRRQLTRAERMLAMHYNGGACWIKVTFEGQESAERACEASPHLIQGHWVHAAMWTGQFPRADVPIPNLVGMPDKRDFTSSAGLSSDSFDDRGNDSAVMPGFRKDTLLVQDHESTNLLRARKTGNVLPSSHEKEGSNLTTATPSARFSNFPDVPKTQLRSVQEALLPAPSSFDRIWVWLKASVLPSDVIGHSVPRTTNGAFDTDSSSLYWRVCYWIDTLIGSDICGMKDA